MQQLLGIINMIVPWEGLIGTTIHWMQPSLELQTGEVEGATSPSLLWQFCDRAHRYIRAGEQPSAQLKSTFEIGAAESLIISPFSKSVTSTASMHGWKDSSQIDHSYATSDLTKSLWIFFSKKIGEWNIWTFLRLQENHHKVNGVQFRSSSVQIHEKRFQTKQKVLP